MSDTLLYNNGLGTVLAGNIKVTPTGGAQETLASARATATGGAVSATTLTASGAVTLSPASANVVLSPSGSGVVTIDPAPAGAMDNVAPGVTTPWAVHATTLGATGAVSLT